MGRGENHQKRERRRGKRGREDKGEVEGRPEQLVSAQEGDMAPAPAPGMASSTNSSLPVLGGILITSLMSFLALLSH
ncbi:hypothetical protein MRB53_006047 [Persea americana]|uniref:Uncharacterized protein n=1 Tax=Persea americana TaxID=3435 RepID=A0ACC2MFA5_PERAE|nr:hypothetical protein MRB53_006047 [Persea americana]